MVAWIRAVGQQNDGHLLVKINPKRSSGIAKMTDGMALNNVPDEEGAVGVSQPKAQPEDGGICCRVVNCEIVSGRKMLRRRSSKQSARRSMSGTFENNPACPLTPPNRQQLPS